MAANRFHLTGKEEMGKRAIMSRLAIAVVLTTLGCSGIFNTGKTVGPGEQPEVIEQLDILQSIYGNSPGEECTNDGDCRIGLECQASVCTAVGGLEEGQCCVLSSDCADGLVGSINTENLEMPKSCMPQGDGEQWDLCTMDKDCQKGLYCQPVAFTGTCQPAGEGEVGTNCEDTGDCAAGLYCGIDGRCGIMGNQIQVYKPMECKSSGEIGGEPRVLFEVPRNGQPLPDFYRLPFPNDVRIKDGKLDLSGHPTPGPGVVGFDVAARVIKAMEEDLSGFGTNPVVFFRFSERPGLKSIKTGKEPNVIMVDITDQMESGYGKKMSISWVASTGRGLYICQNYLAVYVPWARPLKGNHTYAVLILDSVMTDPTEGNPEPFAHDDDFKLMMSDAIPGDGDLKAAWEVFTPLRQFLSTTQADNLGVVKSAIVGATVFTTYDPTDRMAKFKEEMDTIDLPEIVDAVLCDGQAVSPCDDGLIGEAHERGCMEPDPDFHEIQGIVKVPTFQSGNKPYVEPEDGGGVEWDALGRPIVQGFEEICFSFTIPKGTPPEDGWPAVLYGHGTGGNYRSQIATGVAETLSKLKVWNDDTGAYDRDCPMAVFGWDQVLHGPRIGDAPLDPDALVFNFRNPRAALGNFYQGASEAMVLARLLVAWNDSAPAIDNVDTTMNPEAVQFLGHSQGGISGPLAMPFVDAVDSMVISGTGGGLVESMLRKSSPVDVKEGVIVALQDENVGRTHPILAMLQNYYDPVDPINYASLLFYTPFGGHKVRTFHPLGISDLHTPPKTMKALSQAMRAMLARSPSLAEEDFEPFDGVQQVELPYKVSGGITVEYGLPPEDGHFVIFQNEDARRHYTNFLGTAVLDDKPLVVE